MKAFVFVFLFCFCSAMNGFAQNRIHEWEIEKITSISVELTSLDNKTETFSFSSQQDIDKIMSFLKAVDFRDPVGASIDPEEQMDKGSCKIVFQGQRDQVYLYERSACIGKSSFIIDDNVIDDFRSLVKSL